ncbi:hypothetical protein QGM71_01110 [Virgibacillus sp. C22-A2]|uniref:Uncharacterized protein n=1 Tax=Virgibacillus tibetensis TaxID=3042313 RepID=A0ABU6K9S5_9BACI|nr:hypothetical protein [Virgibacillus sp. C22-A2]
MIITATIILIVAILVIIGHVQHVNKSSKEGKLAQSYEIFYMAILTVSITSGIIWGGLFQ